MNSHPEFSPLRHKILIFIAEAAVHPFFVTGVMLGRVMADLGHDVLLPRCGGHLERCVAKDSFAMPVGASTDDIARFCRRCNDNHDRLATQPGLQHFPLEAAIRAADCDRAAAIESAVADGDLEAFTFNGLAFGQLVFHDLFLIAKLLSVQSLEPDHFRHLRQTLRTALSVYLGLRRFLEEQAISDLVVYGHYAVNAAAIFAAREVGTNWRILNNMNHVGVDWRHLSLTADIFPKAAQALYFDWPIWREVPIAEQRVEEIGFDIVSRMIGHGSHTYSPARQASGADLLNQLALSPTRPLIVAYTSSLDEFVALDCISRALGGPVPNPPGPFVDQIAWLAGLIGLARARPDLQMVVRIHPREDSNRRDSRRSEHLALLNDLLQGRSDNVKVVGPREPISSYDLLEIADLVAVWSSTIGLEAARLGVPVVKAQTGFHSLPEGDFVLSPQTPDELAGLVHGCLSWQPGLNRLILAWRWYAHSRFGLALDIGDLMPAQMTGDLPIFRRPARAQDLSNVLFNPVSIASINRRRARTGRAEEDRERSEVRQQILGILYFLLTGQTDRDFSGPVEIAVSDKQVAFRWRDFRGEKFSPLAVRLIRMIQDPT